MTTQRDAMIKFLNKLVDYTNPLVVNIIENPKVFYQAMRNINEDAVSLRAALAEPEPETMRSAEEWSIERCINEKYVFNLKEFIRAIQQNALASVRGGKS